MVARSTTLQSEAGYIDARPYIRQTDEISCDARPDHTSGSRSVFPALSSRWQLHPRQQTRLQPGCREWAISTTGECSPADEDCRSSHDVALPPLALTYLIEDRDSARRLHDAAKTANTAAELRQPEGQTAVDRRAIDPAMCGPLPPETRDNAVSVAGIGRGRQERRLGLRPRQTFSRRNFRSPNRDRFECRQRRVRILNALGSFETYSWHGHLLRMAASAINRKSRSAASGFASMKSVIA
jgi:hypothetical protein